ncbi:MAG TPA: rubrerythrin [candidate division Zixibacteria bacterium]|nr:rubrerythrin [candidate division Zixibacteria bacterium]
MLGTDDNLKAAFAGESRAFMKYLAFAAAADKEGRKQVAKLFRALAEAERIHAQSHLALMGQVADSEHNLSNAIDGETYEFTQMYPSFIALAEKEGNQRAVISFRNAMAAEKVHGNLLTNLLEKLGAEKESDYYVCSICGHTVAGYAPEKCPSCSATKEKFKQVS